MVGGLSFIVSLSMSEIAAALPTAGGIYYWSYRLGGAEWGYAFLHATGHHDVLTELKPVSCLDDWLVVSFESLTCQLNLVANAGQELGWMGTYMPHHRST